MVDCTLTWQLDNLSRSRGYRRKLLLVDRLCASPPELNINLRSLIGAILLIEMHQRPGAIRAAEWMISGLVPGRLRRPITRGPLQIADGPWNLGAAINIACKTLRPVLTGALNEQSSVNVAAIVWNGKAVRQPCSMYGYGEVLLDAYAIADRSLGDLRRAPATPQGLFAQLHRRQATTLRDHTRRKFIGLWHKSRIEAQRGTSHDIANL